MSVSGNPGPDPAQTTTTTAGRPAVPRVRKTFLLAAGIALLAALPFLAAGVSGTFVAIDDQDYVTANPQVAQGLDAAGAHWALTAFHAGNWHPLTWLSHMLDVTLFGLDARGHHATSILLHALNAALLFVSLRRMTGATGRSALVAAMFGVHPLHVESVAWVAERKDVLSGFFFMLVLLAYERYSRLGGAWRYLAALALCALGLAAKPMLVTLPFLLLVLDVWPLGRTPFGRTGGVGAPAPWGRILIEKVPFALLAAASSVVTALAQREGGAWQDLQSLAPGSRAANAIVSLAAYLQATLWPAGLAVYYPHPGGDISRIAVAAAALLLAVLSLAAFKRPAGQPFLAIGWCWFAGMLVPVLGLVQVGSQARADRYTYLPLIGIFLALTWLAAQKLPAPLRQPAAGVPATAAILAALTAASAMQAGHWRDSETLFAHALSVTKDNWLIENNLAALYGERGRPEEAIAHAREAVRIDPGNAKARYNLGTSLALLERHEEAIASYREALRLRPDLSEAHNNLGFSLAALGRHPEAVANYRAAVGFKPYYPRAYANLGISLATLGRHAEAVASYREALRLQPDLVEAHNNLGHSLAALKRHGEAISSYRTAVGLRPDYPRAYMNLGLSLAALGRRAEAIASYREALRLQPDFPAARQKLDLLLTGSTPARSAP